jgi:hypothetical protein
MLTTTDKQTATWRAPAASDDAEILFDEPGRILVLKPHSLSDVCFRSHHFQVTKEKYGPERLHVRHGGGDESWPLPFYAVKTLEGMDSDTRYFTLYAIMSAHKDAARAAASATADKYSKAFVDGRLKKRKVRGQAKVKIWIEPEVRNVANP